MRIVKMYPSDNHTKTLQITYSERNNKNPYAKKTIFQEMNFFHPVFYYLDDFPFKS